MWFDSVQPLVGCPIVCLRRNLALDYLLNHLVPILIDGVEQCGVRNHRLHAFVDVCELLWQKWLRLTVAKNLLINLFRLLP